MIDKMYYYFIKTKYGKYTNEDVKELKKYHDKVYPTGLGIHTLSNTKRDAIEVGVMGNVLTTEHRHVDNYILGNEFIVNAFIEDEGNDTRL